jgi:hypothetical protein
MNLQRPLAVRVTERWGTLAGLCLARIVTACVVAGPFTATLGASGVGRFDRGDARLFEPGGMLLLEVLGRSLRGLAFDLRSSLLPLGVAWLFGLVMHAVLLVALASPGALQGSVVAARVTGLFWRLLGVSAIGLLLQALAILLFGSLTLTLFGSASHVSTFLGPAVLGIVVVVLIGAFTDLARASLVSTDGATLGSLMQALRATRKRPLPLFLAYALPALGALATLGLAATLVGRIPLEHGGPLAALGVAVIHLVALAAQLVFRAVWLARAVEFSAR